MLEILLTIVHVIVCLFLVIVVLLQSGKAGDIASAFGGMGSQAVFGPRTGANLMTRLTTIAAALFMVSSLSLAIVATRGAGGSTSSVLKDRPTVDTSRPQAPIPAQQPSVELQGADGKKKTIPLNIPSAPSDGKGGLVPVQVGQPDAKTPAAPAPSPAKK
jgi:preprotein translocase subunit SecG